MSSTITPHGAPRPAEGEPPQLSPRNEQKARALGLTSATGLVIGSIIGTGIFAMRPCSPARARVRCLSWR
jgi:Na+/glutamate symporter